MNGKAGIITRFAPSPTGYLHLGHAYSALLNFERARREGGRFILRIEDIDFTRCNPACEQAIFDDLSWLGLTWETPIRRQSSRLPVYEEKLQELHADGLVYRCFKTRKDIAETLSAPHTSQAAYTGAPDPQEAEKLACDLPFSWRLHMQKACALTGEHAAARHGDVILGRKDIGTSYHLSCVMDDAEQGITHILRGTDLADFADLHILLFRLLGHTPPTIEHHALITGPDGRRLAKREHAQTLRALRQSGLTPADIRACLPLSA